MIPSHDSELVSQSKIVLNRLSKLNAYDYTEPHRHNYFEFFYFENGGGTHLIDFEEVFIESNSIHIVAPGQVHQMKRDKDSTGYVFLFGFSSLAKNSVYVNFLNNHICYSMDEISRAYVLPKNQEQFIPALLESCFDTSLEKKPFTNQVMLNTIERLCLYCLLEEGVKNEVPENDYGKFRSLLIDNFREMKLAKTYADELKITSKTLNSLTKKYAGKTPSQLIHHQLILEAKRLLMLGISVKEAAYELKFDDPAHFSKFFKTQTNLSPTEFREAHK